MKIFSSKQILNISVKFYLILFFLYLLLPLFVVSLGAFNSSAIPSISPWKGFTYEWVVRFFNNFHLMKAIFNSFVVAFGVVILSVPIGLAGALFLFSIEGKAKSIFYAILVSPILTPGIIIGISILVMSNSLLGISGGLFLTIIGQSAFISSMAMLLFMSRLQKFNKNLEMAALDLGAHPSQVFFRITLPFLKPSIYSAIALVFLQSIQNYNTTLFLVGAKSTITIFIGSMIKLGLNPVLNVLAFITISIAVIFSVAYALKQRREVK